MSLLEGLKSAITSEAAAQCPAVREEREIVQQVWERVCSDERATELCHSQGGVLLTCLSECLAAIEYTPLPFDVSMLLSK